LRDNDSSIVEPVCEQCTFDAAVVTITPTVDDQVRCDNCGHEFEPYEDFASLTRRYVSAEQERIDCVRSIAKQPGGFVARRDEFLLVDAEAKRLEKKWMQIVRMP
jgi:hypothetical protein